MENDQEGSTMSNYETLKRIDTIKSLESIFDYLEHLLIKHKIPFDKKEENDI
jgi:hypothetical protein